MLLTSGERVPLTALFAGLSFTQTSDLAQQLGCALTEQGLVRVDDFGSTSAADVFAAGDNSSPLRQLSVASTRDDIASVFLNRELIIEYF